MSKYPQLSSFVSAASDPPAHFSFSERSLLSRAEANVGNCQEFNECPIGARAEQQSILQLEGASRRSGRRKGLLQTFVCVAAAHRQRSLIIFGKSICSREDNECVLKSIGRRQQPLVSAASDILLSTCQHFSSRRNGGRKKYDKTDEMNGKGRARLRFEPIHFPETAAKRTRKPEFVDNASQLLVLSVTSRQM